MFRPLGVPGQRVASYSLAITSNMLSMSERPRMILRKDSPRRLDRLMEAKGLTQAELARQAGCTPGTINHLLNGRMLSCTPDLGGRLVAILGCEPGYLFAQRSRTMVA